MKKSMLVGAALRRSLMATTIVLAPLALGAPALADEAAVRAAELEPERCCTSAVWDGTHAYVFGGCTSEPNCALDDIAQYHPSTDTLQVVSRLPSARFSTSAAWDGEHAYVFGGCTAFGCEEDDLLDEIVQVTPATGGVALMQARLPSPRSGTSAVFDGRYAYIFGGSTGVHESTDQIVRYDPVADAVSVMGARLPDDPQWAMAAAWDGARHAYLFGGCSRGGCGSDAILEYEPATDALVALGAVLPGPVAFASAVWDGANAYVFGASEALCFSMCGSKIVRVNPAASAVVVMNASLPHRWTSASAVWDGKHAYLFGGYGPGCPLLGLLGCGTYLGDIVRYRLVPGSPQALAAAPLPRGAVTLVWQGPAANTYAPTTFPIEGYRVYRSEGPWGLRLVADVGPEQTYQDATCARLCFYAVAAYTSAGEGPLSNLALGTLVPRSP